jgi:RNA polymerase sigma factor (sigma-70 family)
MWGLWLGARREPWTRGAWLARHVLPHEPALRTWLRRLGVHGAEADEVVQETYAVLAGMAGAAETAAPRACAFETARAVMRRRAGRCGREWTGEIDADVAAAAMVATDPEPAVACRQDEARLRALIAELAPARREAFSLRKLEGLSQREVARRMAISEREVERHIAGALLDLMTAMTAFPASAEA